MAELGFSRFPVYVSGPLGGFPEFPFYLLQLEEEGKATLIFLDSLAARIHPYQ